MSIFLFLNRRCNISLAKSTILAISSRNACLIRTRAFEVTTKFNQSRLGD